MEKKEKLAGKLTPPPIKTNKPLQMNGGKSGKASVTMAKKL
jgi:hypothetical protein